MKRITPAELKVLRVRECAAPDPAIETPEQAFHYWRVNIPSAPWFDPNKESFVVLLLNTRKGILGHNLVSLGTLDACLVHPRDVLRPAIAAGAAGLILAHNHPSGDASPSGADIRVTQELAQGAKLLRIQLIDHLIVGGEAYVSLKQLGYLQDYSTCG